MNLLTEMMINLTVSFIIFILIKKMHFFNSKKISFVPSIIIIIIVISFGKIVSESIIYGFAPANIIEEFYNFIIACVIVCIFAFLWKWFKKQNDKYLK